MKTKALVAAALLLSLSFATGHAATSIDGAAIPQAAKSTIKKYFPGSKVLTVRNDTGDDDIPHYDIVIKYKAIKLDVEITPTGRLIDVDMR